MPYFAFLNQSSHCGKNGAEKGVGTQAGSGVNSNDILSAIQHPDPSTGHPSSSQQDKYLTDALGDVVQSTDRNGNVHQYSYDVLGRLTSDNVTSFGVGVDATIQQITYGYDSQGNRSLITSLKAGGTIANQVERFFNGLGQLTTEYQAHNGEVNLPNTPGVQYAYNEMSNGQNNSRLVSMTYPDGYVVHYNYNAGLDSNISRLSSLSDSSGTLESYLYLGLNTVVERDHPQTGINLTYIQQAGDTLYNSDGGDQYTGLDRFGRVIDQFWINASNGTTVDRYQYGYNQDSEVLYRQNLVDTAMGELYSYDNLGQLTSFQRGTLNSSRNGIVGSPSHSQSWTPDALGNFTGVTTDGNPQARTANQQNEYTSITGQSAPTYDADGNLTADGAGNTYVYDAWNRLVTVKNNGTAVASYIYDGLNRRVQISESNSLTDSYYSSSDQGLENYQGSTVTFIAVWSPVYVNALVYSAKGNPLQRYYALQDANWNTTAWVQSGTVVEREAYDPFGAVTVLSPSWGVQSSPLHLASGFQGMGYDWLVGLDFSDGERVYNPVLMRWQQTDPSGQAADVNLFRFVGNQPTDMVDPSGLAPPDMSQEGIVWDAIEEIYANEGYDLSPQDLLDAVAEYLGTDTQSVAAHVASYLDFYSPSGVTDKDIEDIANIADHLPDGLTAGATIPKGNKEWVREAPAYMAEAAQEAALAALSFVPGPEIFLFRAFAKLKGLQYVKKAGKWILNKVVCKGGVQVVEAVGEAEAKALYAEFKKAPGKIVDFSGELVRDRANATRSLRNALGTNSQIARPHHIIPWEARDLPIVQSAARGGFNINGADNGISLLLKVHPQGARHPRYNAAVMKLLEALGKRNLSDAEAAAEVQAIVDQLRSGLDRLNQSGVPLR